MKSLRLADAAMPALRPRRPILFNRTALQ